jgi:nucleotide-binding universal stress UspA family protein
MFKDILIPVDLNDDRTWLRPLAIAVDLAKRYDARLHVMNVVPDLHMPLVAQYFPPDYERTVRENAQERLHALIHREVPEGVTRQAIVAQGSIYREIVAAIRSLNCDLVVMGSHHPELGDYLLGANADRVVRHADCSVMVVRDRPSPGG